MTQEHFEHVAAVYDEVFRPHILNHYASRRTALFESLCPPNGRILDHGCGTGFLGQRLIERHFQVCGTENSAGMLEKALERGVQGVMLREGRIPFESDQFDLVYSVAVFHHLETQEAVRQAVQEMVRVTKPGGQIVVWDHNPLNPFWPVLMRRWPQDSGTERLVAVEEILEAFDHQPIDARRYFRAGWTPEFVPAFGMPIMRRFEWLLEHLPVVRRFSAHNVVVARKRR